MSGVARKSSESSLLGVDVIEVHCLAARRHSSRLRSMIPCSWSSTARRAMSTGALTETNAEQSSAQEVLTPSSERSNVCCRADVRSDPAAIESHASEKTWRIILNSWLHRRRMQHWVCMSRALDVSAAEERFHSRKCARADTAFIVNSASAVRWPCSWVSCVCANKSACQAWARTSWDAHKQTPSV